MAFFMWQGFRKARHGAAPAVSHLLSPDLAHRHLCDRHTAVLGGSLLLWLRREAPTPMPASMHYLAQANTIYPIWALPTQACCGEPYGRQRRRRRNLGHAVDACGDIRAVHSLRVASGKRWLIWFIACFAGVIFDRIGHAGLALCRRWLCRRRGGAGLLESGRLVGGAELAQFSSILRAEMKASCGISTLPNCRIFFLPSFCLSRSLRLRLMSPP